jgi:hypothetical protein
MKPPACRLCQTAHWSHQPHVFRPSLLEPDKEPDTEPALPPASEADNQPDRAQPAPLEDQLWGQSEVSRREEEAKNRTFRALLEAMPTAKPRVKPEHAKAAISDPKLLAEAQRARAGRASRKRAATGYVFRT